MNIIFRIEGGLGKHIMATAVCKGIKKQYPSSHLIVISAYPDVFYNNPYVNERYSFNHNENYYIKYIKDKSCKFFNLDPYDSSDYITTNKHLLQIWFELLGLKYNGEQPEIFLTEVEKTHYRQFYLSEKPIFVFQSNGGPPGLGYYYSWTRDIPETTMSGIIDYYKNTHTIIQIRREDQITYRDVRSALEGFRSIAILLQMSQKRLLIDSFGQHLAAALNIPSVVLWVDTKPEVFGYNIHNNIKANPYINQTISDQSIFSQYFLSEPIPTFPYNSLDDVFNVRDIIHALNNF